jgi:CheY-like chemotaxis protein
MRTLTARILGSAGYTVLTAASGEEALAAANRHGADIALLLTDVVMPRMSGPMLVERLGAVCPTAKVLYMSGYTDEAIVHHGVLEPGTRFIGKPFVADDLSRKVREVLDEE